MAAACPTDVAAQAPAPEQPATPRRDWPRSSPPPPAAPDGVAAPWLDVWLGATATTSRAKVVLASKLLACYCTSLV
jgi:hypothetical protein